MTLKTKCEIGMGVISPCTQCRNPSEGKVRSNFQLKRAPKRRGGGTTLPLIQLQHKGSISENKKWDLIIGKSFSLPNPFRSKVKDE